jgi:hypothetical protein
VNKARATKVGKDEDLSSTEDQSEHRGRDRDGDEDCGKDVEVPSIYSNKMNK